MSKRNRRKRQTVRPSQERPLLDIETALEIVDDDLPDGAYWAVLEEMTGKEPGEIAEWLEANR